MARREKTVHVVEKHTHKRVATSDALNLAAKVEIHHATPDFFLLMTYVSLPMRGSIFTSFGVTFGARGSLDECHFYLSKQYVPPVHDPGHEYLLNKSKELFIFRRSFSRRALSYPQSPSRTAARGGENTMYDAENLAGNNYERPLVSTTGPWATTRGATTIMVHESAHTTTNDKRNRQKRPSVEHSGTTTLLRTRHKTKITDEGRKKTNRNP